MFEDIGIVDNEGVESRSAPVISRKVNQVFCNELHRVDLTIAQSNLEVFDRHFNNTASLNSST